MQPKTKKHLMSNEAAEELLLRAHTGVLSMSGPYAIPLHFLWADGMLYVHGSKTGEKVDRMKADKNVCFVVYEPGDYIIDNPKTACNISMAYSSVIVKGSAAEVTDTAKKREILYAFGGKYHAPLQQLDMPDASLNATILMEITPSEVTGKKIPG